MSVENSRFGDVVHGLIHSNADTEWRKSLSGRIFSNLEAIATRMNKMAAVSNQGSLHEVFSLDKDSASLTKRLADATVGEDGGRIETYAECWEYKHFPWWKEALHVEGKLAVILLDTPIVKLAVDAQVIDPEGHFDPEKVVAKYRLNPSGDLEHEQVVQQWVKDQIKETANPLLQPEYQIEEYERQLRLRAQTEPAKASRQENNAVYERAKAQVVKAAAELETRYAQRVK